MGEDVTEPTELFLMPGLKPALESLERQLEISSNYLDHILIRGPRGSGKSYFVQIIKEHFGHFQEILDCDCENIPHSELTKWLQYDLNENRIIILDHLESVKKDEYQYLNGLTEKARIVAIFRDGDNSIVPEALEMFKITIDIPPLFEHRADILYFIAKKWSDRGISSENLMSLCAYRWPGNLRELDRALQQLFSTHCLPDELTRVSEFHYIFNSLLENGLNFSELVLAIDKCFSYVVCAQNIQNKYVSKPDKLTHYVRHRIRFFGHRIDLFWGNGAWSYHPICRIYFWPCHTSTMKYLHNSDRAFLLDCMHHRSP